MTRTHVFAVAVVTTLGAGGAFAQVPAPPVPPSVPAAPTAVPSPAPAAPARDRLARERDRIAGERDRAIDLFRAQTPFAQLPNLHLPHLDIQLGDLDAQLADLDVQLREADVRWPDVNLDFDFRLDALRDFDFAELARNAREVADVALSQVPTVAPVPPVPPLPPQAPQPAPYVRIDSRSPEGLYDQARGYIDRDQYERALDPLNRLISLKAARADGAMYWKAYSLSKLARSTEALSTLGELRKQYPNSSWIRDVGFLELEVRQSSGQSVSADAQASEDMKLLALQGIMRSDPETAIPVVERTLSGNSSVRVKERALFVLSQSRVPRARDVVIGVAKSASNPDLRVSAIRYMGRISGPETLQALEDIYRGTNDVDVKRAALQALSMAKATDRLGSIARTEKDGDLRRQAIRQLGSSNTPESAESLRAIYQSETDAELKRVVIDSLSSNRSGATVLVTLARAEKDGPMKTEIVRRLANMRSPEAQQYMLELLK